MQKLSISSRVTAICFFVFFIQGCGVTYSGMSGSSGGMSGGSSGGMSGSSGGMSGSSGGMSGSSGSMSGGSSGGMSGSGDDIRGMGGQSGASSYPGETNSQRKKRLEGELENSVGGLDEVLGQEQRKIESVGRNTEGFGGSASRGGVGLGRQSTGGTQRGGSSSRSMGNSSREASVEGLSEAEIEARTPDDIPDLVSEDVVSKQLREAALSEDDPELRERLWEEYRNYNKF